MRLRYSALAALLLLAVMPAGAERRYILRTPSGTAASVAGRHGLGLNKVHKAGDQDFALVSDYLDRAQAHVIQSIRGAEVNAAIEPDVPVRLAENVSGAQLNQSTVAILDAAGRPDVATYYGDKTWSGYVTQPAGSVIRVADAQRAFASGAGVVAVIDTGADLRHPVLKSVLLHGFDFTRDVPGGSEMADVAQSTVAILDRKSVNVFNNGVAKVNQSTVAILDQSTVAILDAARLPAAFGHGTMVAGLVHYVAPTAHILPIKAFRADGSGSLYDILQSIYYAVERGAKVINMSFSMDEPSAELRTAIAYANSRNVVCVGSVGNSGKQMLVYPAAWPQVEGVASTTLTDARSSFSNFGRTVSIAAPGENLITTYPGNNYAGVSGTSFSAALISGGVALLAQLDFAVNQEKASKALIHGAEPTTNFNNDAKRVDLVDACLFAALNSGRR